MEVTTKASLQEMPPEDSAEEGGGTRIVVEEETAEVSREGGKSVEPSRKRKRKRAFNSVPQSRKKGKVIKDKIPAFSISFSGINQDTFFGPK